MNDTINSVRLSFFTPTIANTPTIKAKIIPITILIVFVNGSVLKITNTISSNTPASIIFLS